MATAQKLTDNFLKCTVCTDVFTDPCTLQCNHSFCRKCVVSFTKESPDAVKLGGIPCPTCRQVTKVEDPSRPIDRWADDLNALFLLQGLMDAFGPNSKDTETCSWCRDRGEITPAIHWCDICDDALCENCVKTHRRLPTIRHHDVTEMSPGVKIKRKRKIICSDHPGETMEFHCEDCDKVICQKCSITRHRECKSVVDIAAQMDKMKKILEQKMQTIDGKHMKGEQQIEELKKDVDSKIENEREIQSEIESRFEAIFRILNDKKAQLITTLRKLSQQQLSELKSDVKTREISLNTHKQDRELLDQALKSDSEMDVFQLYARHRNETENTDNRDTRTRKDMNIAWVKSIAFVKAIEDIRFGEIKITTPVPSLDLTSTPVLEDTIQIKVAGDVDNPWGFDVIALDFDDFIAIVVTDSNNNSVKSFYSRNSRPSHSKITMGQKPRCLTVVKENHVAVTVPESNQINLVEVNPELKLLSAIRTEKKYWSIKSLTKSTLAVGCLNGQYVDILDMTGHVLKSISPHINNKPVIADPWYICTTGEGNLVVSNYTSKSVVCVSQEGDVVFNYTGADLKGNPTGVVSTHTGDILVNVWDNRCILHLTSTGLFVRKFLTLTGWVNGLYVGSGGRFYVSDNSDNVVRVYSCSREK